MQRWRRRRREVTMMALRRIAYLVPLLLIITAAVFSLAAISPFDPLDAYMGGQAGALSADQQAMLAHQLGLDQPWWRTWLHWLGQVAQGDLGTSRYYRQPVAQVIADRLPWTLLLGALGLLIAVLLSFVLGLWAGTHPGSVVDRMISALASILQATPPFVLALAALSVFALTLHWVPTGGLTAPGEPVTFSGTLHHIVVPACVLGVSQIPWLVLSLRESVAASLRADYVTGARVRGIDRRTIIRAHVLPTSVPPFIALIGARLPELIVGSTLVESIFAWPGLGASLVHASQSLDFPLLTFLTVSTTAVVLVGNLLADAIIIVSDPRVDADV